MSSLSRVTMVPHARQQTGVIPTQSLQPQRQSAIVFEKYGDTVFLNRVLLAGDTTGVATIPSKAEKKAEETASVVEDHSVTAKANKEQQSSRSFSNAVVGRGASSERLLMPLQLRNRFSDPSQEGFPVAAAFIPVLSERLRPGLRAAHAFHPNRCRRR